MSLALLVVDDEMEIRELLSSYVEDLNVKVIHASHGLEALEILKKQRIDILISDIEMPQMDGETLIKESRKSGFQGPVMVVSASLSERIIADLSSVGVKSFICKSRPGNLRETLRAFIQTLKNNSLPTFREKKASSF